MSSKDEIVLIRAKDKETDYMVFWRPEAKGYTACINRAGKWERAEAEKMVSHCGEEKGIELLTEVELEDWEQLTVIML